jgi:hypothetical protein
MSMIKQSITKASPNKPNERYNTVDNTTKQVKFKLNNEKLETVNRKICFHVPNNNQFMFDKPETLNHVSNS